MAAKVNIDRLRLLRRKIKGLSDTLAIDLKCFLSKDRITFFVNPDREHQLTLDPPSVSTTCTCLMALALSNKFDAIYKGNTEKSIKSAFNTIVKEKWTSSGLPPFNAFTRTMILRSFGFLYQHSIFEKNGLDIEHEEEIENGKCKKSLKDIIISMIGNIEQSIRIQGYPSSVPIAYWLIDAIDRIKVDFIGKKWIDVYRWASKEFEKHLSLVVSGNDAKMDPISLAMAACLCAKLRRIAENRELGTANIKDISLLEIMPSHTELAFSIRRLFKFQLESGIWPKYFPMFHYPKAGSNYCFAFEMLEAVLHEFGEDRVFSIQVEEIIEGLEKAVKWCVNNRLEYQGETNRMYTGWNSGGQITSLSKGMPESWATAAIHMFLWKLRSILSKEIQKEILERYQAKVFPCKDDKKWNEFIDVEVKLQGQKNQTVKGLIEKYIINPIENQSANKFDSRSITSLKQKKKRSALLFGPPGTSKTTLTDAVAAKLGWPLIKLDPSHFLSRNIENIYVRAEEIFKDLDDLEKVVVLFDEMDALVQTRDDRESRIDITSRFLTTCMLPKLANLHDKNNLIFFMATNHIENFDPAIKRPGRFDLLICMGLPSTKKKLEHLEHFLMAYGLNKSQVSKARQLFQITLKKPDKVSETLEYFTYGEFHSFIENLIDEKILVVDPTPGNIDKLSDKILKWEEYIFLNNKKKNNELSPREKYDDDRLKSQVQ